MLMLKSIHAGYDGMEVLKGVSLNVAKDQIVAIIGPNGAGKSTLLKGIFNLCEVYKGKISFKGRDITGLPTHQLIHEGISYVPQGREVFANLTVRENLEMGGFILDDKNQVEEGIKKAYARFPFLKEREEERAYALSGGQQQMLSIGRALLQRPKLLLMDEPSLGLSPKAMKEVFDKVKKINKEGIGVMLVEQNAKQAVDIAHHTFVLEDGKIALDGGKELLKEGRIKDIYFGGR